MLLRYGARHHAPARLLTRRLRAMHFELLDRPTQGSAGTPGKDVQLTR